MINIVFTPSLLLAFLIFSSFIVLYFVGYITPNNFNISLVRRVDGLYNVLGFIYIVILLAHGWRLDPILLFSQYIFFSIVLTLLWDNLRLRGMISYIDPKVNPFLDINIVEAELNDN